jgi:hypothetical protein
MSTNVKEKEQTVPAGASAIDENAEYFDVLGVKISRKEVEKYIVRISHNSRGGNSVKEYMTVAGKVKMFMKFLEANGYLYKMDEDVLDEDARVRIRIKITVYKQDGDGGYPLYEFVGGAAEYRDSRGSYINQKYAYENAETSALGRALGLGLGIGTELGSIESAERMNAALSESVPATAKQKTFIKQSIANFDENKRAILNMVLNDEFGISSLEQLNLNKLDKPTASRLIDAIGEIRKGR